MTKAVMAARRTAPAARSLIFPATEFCSGDTLLTSSSIAEFASSVLKTKPIAREMNIHSEFDSRKKMPAMITPMAATR